MCISEINENREKYDFKPITGDKNTVIIETVASNASFILTFKQWLLMKRRVKEGQKALLSLKGANHFKDKNGNEQTKFYNFSVFDIKQTRELTKEEIEKLIEKGIKFRV